MTELTHWEKVVLVSSVTFLWHARYKQAKEHTGIGTDDWRAAAKSLRAKGLLATPKYTPTASGMEWARGKRMDYVTREVVNAD